MTTLNPPQTTKPIQIFRVGTHTAMNGQKYTFTLADVREIADGYRAEFAAAPAVIGHPKLTSPRWGRASKLSVTEDGILMAELDQVVPAFAAAVKAKQYPQVSAAIFMPDAPGNPTPGKHYLQHIGFLGGATPAVAGLEQVEFSADAVGVVNFAYSDKMIVRIFRSLKNWLIERDGVEKADAIISDWDLEYLAEDAKEQEPAASFAAPLTQTTPPPTATQTPSTTTEVQLTQTELEARAAALAKKEAEFSVRVAAQAAIEKTAALKGNAEFAQALVQSGKLLPGETATVVTVLARLDGVDSKVAEFAAGDPREGKSGGELFKDFLEALPKRVTFERIAPANTQVAGVAEFAAPAGFSVESDSAALMNKANAYMAANPNVEFLDAVMAVQT